MFDWYHTRAKQKFGPFSPAQFKHLAEREGTSQWVPAGSSNGRGTVSVAILDLNLLTPGEVAFYRPLPKNAEAN